MTEEEILARQLFDAAGPWSIPVLCVVFGVRLWRMPSIQSFIPEKVRWSTLSMPVRLGVVFAASIAASMASSMIAGKGWMTALVAAVPIAMASVMTHKITKIVGHTMQDSVQQGRQDYRPSKMRKVASIVVPLNHKKIGSPPPPSDWDVR